ncbi:DUF2974 domain-containing protein [Enterococcus sp. BWT-B8]|uniref:Mbeg1-like protein n=1 Tax=Enterococcus sp. BWT-B8 TaxID=2885157 RepID=UPI001E2AD49E|nr:Mbeg1-like protein [Enterococcus sp. BWT-B8]MCB5950573.1 DUF2974 domain-containing protein [Enterococcus sp. BWT-B8]
MAQPTESELLILNAIIYTNDFVNQAENMSIYEWAVQFDSDNLDDSRKPAEMSKTEFQKVIHTIKENKSIYHQMIVRDINNEQYANESGSQRVTNAAVAYGEDLIILYKGTAGDLEWRDNGIGGYTKITDTEQQKLALDYFDKMRIQHGRDKIYVSGHSKGGNKAQYIGVLRGEQLEHVYSFDGQGFNQSFLLKYKQQIEVNKNKITNISNEYDFVNILLFPIAGNRKYISSTTSLGIMDKSSFALSSSEHVTIEKLREERFGQGKAVLEWAKIVGGNIAAHKAGAWHSPYSMFVVTKQDTLILNDVTEQSTAMKEVQRLLLYFNKYMREEDWCYVCYSVMSAVQSGDKAYGEDYSKMPDGFIERTMTLTKGYLQKQKGIDSSEVFLFLNSILGLNIGSLMISSITGYGYDGLTGTSFTDLTRDFTHRTKDQLLALVEEVEDEPFWDITKWDVFYRIDQYFLGGIDFPGNSKELMNYYRKIIDIQEISAMEIHRIFDEVYETEAKFAQEMEEVKNSAEEILSSLKEISRRIT